MNRRRAARVAAPGVFLLGVTVAVLLVRAGLDTSPAARTGTSPAAAATHGVARTTTTTRRRHRTAATTTAGAAGARYVTVERGDTFYSIAAAAGISLDELEALNPGVSPYAIRVGQRIRVK